jgi:hypothetical protein
LLVEINCSDAMLRDTLRALVDEQQRGGAGGGAPLTPRGTNAAADARSTATVAQRRYGANDSIARDTEQRRRTVSSMPPPSPERAPSIQPPPANHTSCRRRHRRRRRRRQCANDD